MACAQPGLKTFRPGGIIAVTYYQDTGYLIGLWDERWCTDHLKDDKICSLPPHTQPLILLAS